jgi:hypothetical protein
MIENERQLNQTRAAIMDLENAVSALKRDVLPLNPARFALMAEAPVAEIRQLREQIDEFVGINPQILLEAELWMKIEGPTIPEELVTVQGLLREIDLDERSFIIRNPEEAGKETRCQIVPENDDLLEIAKECLDHTVIVRGTRLQDPTRKRTNPLRVEGIGALDGKIDALME